MKEMKRRDAVKVLEKKREEYADDAELPRAIGRAIFDMRQMWKLEIKNGRQQAGRRQLSDGR